MVIRLETKTELRAELKQLLQKYVGSEGEIEQLIEKIWPDIEEAIDFAEFTQALKDTSKPATVVDPLRAFK
jgi:uncharacterized tellurite resistance protein B-like protein